MLNQYVRLVFQRLFTILVLLMFGLSLSWAMDSMDDQALDTVTGQSLFTADYVAPSASSNPSSTIGFYRLTMDAQMDLNMNIKKVQLGCGGVNGAGVCDIDIDQLGLTGIRANGADVGPPTDFTMYRPFVEFAINNPTSAATREVMGIRLGAQSAWGMMNIGTDPGAANNNPATHTGINRFSGDMQAWVDNVNIPVNVCIFLCIPTTATVNVDLPNANNNKFNVVASRATSISLDATNAVNPCSASYGICSQAILGIQVGANMNEDLRFVHQIQIGTDTNGNGKFDVGEGVNDVAFTVQKQNISWQKISSPTTWSQANRGWWMSIPKVIMGNTTTAPVSTGLGGLFGITITNLDLNQSAMDNCYGALTFC